MILKLHDRYYMQNTLSDKYTRVIMQRKTPVSKNRILWNNQNTWWLNFSGIRGYPSSAKLHPRRKLIQKELSFFLEQNMHPRNYIPRNKQKTHNTRKLAHTNLNDSIDSYLMGVVNRKYRPDKMYEFERQILF